LFKINKDPVLSVLPVAKARRLSSGIN